MIDVFFVEEIEQKLLGQISLFIFQNLNTQQSAFARTAITPTPNKLEQFRFL